MTEGLPPTLQQLQQLNRSLTEKVLDKAASDPQWKQQLLDDPEAAVRAADFPETQQLQQMGAGASQEGEVRGQWSPGGGGGGPGGGPGCGWYWWWSPWWGWQQYYWTGQW